MKKFFLILIFIFFVSNTTFAEDCESMTDIFKKYQCRSQKVCKSYDDNKKVYNPEKLKEASEYKNAESDGFFISSTDNKSIKKAVAIYKENMNNTYKCAIIQAQKNSLRKVKQQLLKYDKTWDIKKSIEPKIEELTNRLDITAKATKCLSIDKQTVFNKLSILRQTTYLTCDFAFYAEYLKEYYKDLWNSIWEWSEFSTIDAKNKVFNLSNSIDSEVSQVFKVFPIAYHAYSEYENNFPIHFLLMLIKEDYNILRNNLNSVLNPINQVVYKISNAMTK